MTPETRTILSHLPEFEPKAPNRAAAVEACALEHIPGAKSLPRHDLFERIVHPVLNELGKERLRSASNAGRLKMAASPLSGNGRLQPSRPQLTKRPKFDVSGEPGRNQFERLLSHVKRVQPHLSHDAAFAVACDTNRTHEVVS